MPHDVLCVARLCAKALTLYYYYLALSEKEIIRVETEFIYFIWFHLINIYQFSPTGLTLLLKILHQNSRLINLDQKHLVVEIHFITYSNAIFFDLNTCLLLLYFFFFNLITTLTEFRMSELENAQMKLSNLSWRH